MGRCPNTDIDPVWITLYTLTQYIYSPYSSLTFPLVPTRRICQTIKAPKVGDHFLYSHDLNEQESSLTVRRN